MSRNSKVMGFLMVRSITRTPVMMLAPLLGDVTEDAGLTGALESYRAILRNTGLLLGKPGAGWAHIWGRCNMRVGLGTTSGLLGRC